MRFRGTSKFSTSTWTASFTLRGFRLSKPRPPGLIGRLSIQKTMSGGFHVIARCRGRQYQGAGSWHSKRIEVDGPGEHEYCGKPYTARAHGGKWFIFPGAIETKAERGYVVVAPSPGYSVIQTPPGGEFFDFPVINRLRA